MLNKSMNENSVSYLPNLKIDYPFLQDDQKNRRSHDALNIAFTIFNLEKEINRRNIDSVQIKLSNEKNGNDITEDLINIITFTLSNYVDCEFVKSQLSLKRPRIKKEKKEVDAVCLFSGGVDSFSGILITKKYFNKTLGFFSAHSDQAKIIKIVYKLSENILKKHGIDIFKLKAPAMGKGHYSQSRGFFYMLSAAAYMNLVGAKKLIVSECGPTMYQPQFGPVDTVTLTSNPAVIQISLNIISKILNEEVEILTPFEDLTKAEIMSISPEKKGLKYTHSCITQRFGDHCGTCYGCVIRRLAGIAAGIQDVKYKKDPILDEKANDENLIPLLIFSQDTLLSLDSMEYYQRRLIDTYEKKDLFKRFALDNFAAIHKLIKANKKVTRKIELLYRDTVDVIGESILEERIEKLKLEDFQPNYDAVFKKMRFIA